MIRTPNFRPNFSLFYKIKDSLYNTHPPILRVHFGLKKCVLYKGKYVIGVSGESKSFLGLGYSEMCNAIGCHLKIF